MATPIGTMPLLSEPLHGWERMGLKSLSNTQNLAGNSDMTGALDSLRGFIQAGNPAQTYANANAATAASMNPVTQQEIMGVANPYAQGLKDNLSKNAQALRAQILAKQGMRGGRSFGDTSTGVQNGMLNDSVLSGQNEIDYNTFKDALSQINTERNRSLSAGGQYGNLAQMGMNAIGSQFDLGNRLKESRINDVKNKLGAGRYIRDFNQGIDDKIAADYAAKTQDPLTKLRNTFALLNNYQSGGSYFVPGKTSTFTKAANILGAAGSASTPFGFGATKIDTSNGLPWS